MNFPNSSVFVTVLVLAVALTGCLEPDRAQYRDQAAEEVCDEADRCDNLDGLFGESYDSHADCVISERSRFNTMWPEDECGDDRIDPDAYDQCINRASLAACDGNALDIASAWSECRASQVCTN